MNLRTKILAGVLALLTAFAFGRYSAQSSSSTKTTEVEKQKDTHTETKIVEITKPDGTKEKTTTSVSDSTKQNWSSDSISKVTNDGTSKVHLSVLAGMRINQPIPIYGIHISKQLLGPITIGAFGMTDKTFGVSLGLDF